MDTKAARKMKKTIELLDKVVQEMETIDWNPANRSNDVLDTVVAVKELAQESQRRLNALLSNPYHNWALED